MKIKKRDDLTNWLRNQDEESVVLTCKMKRNQAELLNLLLFRSDYTDMDRLEEDIYRFGESLGKKDDLGRALFICMAMVIRNTGQLGMMAQTIGGSRF